MVHTRDEVIRVMTENYLNSLNMANLPAPDVIQENILSTVDTALKMENAMRDKGDKFRIPHELLPAQIAMILKKLYPIVKIDSGMRGGGVDNHDVLAIYMDNGEDAGTYVTDYAHLRQLIRKYHFTAKESETEETISILSDIVRKVKPCSDRNLIAVNNGIFDYEAKQLLPFTPDKVFLSKSKVDYNPNATNPLIVEPDGNVWDVESWMEELSDDPEVVDLLWHILGAIIRPGVPWHKFACLFSESGNNGKGTLCELMRQLCGEGTYASISMADMGKEFALETMIGVSAIITDENDVGMFIDKAANLKAIVTGDVLQINRKHIAAITYKPRLFMVQCLNEMPKVKDKSNSFTRRQLFVPFTKSFTGHEKKYIKNDFLHRKDVLEYVLKRVLTLMPDYYELPEPQACKIALEEYREFNDPVRTFLAEILPELQWDLVPWSFLYDVYKEWCKETNPSGIVQGKNTFVKDVQAALPSYPESGYIALTPGKEKRDSRGRMTKCEPLIDKYNLERWMNPSYSGKALANTNARCTFPVIYQADKYSGLFRETPKESEEND